MQPDTPAQVSPFTAGDKVRPVESADDWLALFGDRQKPGVLREIAGEMHLVEYDGYRLPYLARDLEKIDD